jgi:multiple antibiotic resistance protein
MDETLFQFSVKALVMLLVVVDPLAAVPPFVALTHELGIAARRSIARRAVLVGFGIAIFFLLLGPALLHWLGVSVDAFRISGGVLLFAAAVPMLFGHRPQLQAPQADERRTVGEDLAIFPLAIPLLTGPGAIATILLLTERARGPLGLLALAGAVSVVYATAWLALRAGERLLLRIGEGKLHIATRVLGIVLAALAVQYVLDGIAGVVRGLAR